MTTEQTLKSIGEKIKTFREAKGLSQSELSTALGVANGHSYISKIEKGTHNITIEKMCEILQVLECEFIIFVKPITKTPAKITPVKQVKKQAIKPQRLNLTGK